MSATPEILFMEPSRADDQPVLQTWVTDEHRTLAAGQPVAWHQQATRSRETIVLRREQTYQEILGFGGALTGGACYVLSRMESSARAKLMHDLFDPAGMALNVCRVCIGASDCSAMAYSYDDGPVDPDLTRFSIEPDRAFILPMLQEARAINPELFLFGSPWSPPGWMKSNGSLKGGCMRHTYMASYADYFLKFLRAYEESGVPIQAVTIQNEVDADQDGLMPACAWPQDYEADFLTMHLGPLFDRAGIKTKIWIIDHNYNLWGRALGELETPDVLKYTNAIAWHGYSGDPAWINRVQSAFPNVEMYFTEAGPNYQDANYETDWTRWGNTFTNILRNWCRSITIWTLASDEHGQPYCGSSPAGIGGAMLIHSQTGEISTSGMYRALGHFSRFIRRGARRIASESDAAGLSHCAFENPGGALVAILTNPGAARTCGIQLGSNDAQIDLAANSVTTVTIS